jgi:hypothetical protein
MKRIYSLFIGTVLLLTLILITPQSMAQEPPHPPSTGHGIKGDQPAGQCAPIGGGISILLVLAAMYSGKRVLSEKKE